MKLRFVLPTLLLALGANAQLVTKPALTLEAAKKIAAAGETEARKNNWNVVIVIVDDGANLIYLQKMDDTQIGSIDIAQGKARTAVRMKRPTKALEDAVAAGRNVLLTLPGATPLEGGIPLMVGGKIVGAIGVSGVQSNQDAQIAQAGAAVLAQMK